MESGKHVYSAVPVIQLPDGDEILDWCGKLVDTVKQTGRHYMLGETTVYRPQTMFCRKKAKEAYQLTTDAGLNVACYGSYYKADEQASGKDSFKSILDTAIALHAPTIRVWAGSKSSADADTKYRQTVINDSIRIAKLAAEANIKISYEYHNNTLTDEPESVRILIQEAKHQNIFLHWQPNQNRTGENALLELQTVLPHLAAIHVFKWENSGNELIRQPLEDGITEWRQYLNIANSKNKTIDAMLEFVKDDSPEQFLQDAATLKKCL